MRRERGEASYFTLSFPFKERREKRRGDPSSHVLLSSLFLSKKGRKQKGSGFLLPPSLPPLPFQERKRRDEKGMAFLLSLSL